MQNESTIAAERDCRVDEVVTAYLKAAEAGEQPDPKAWLARYPDLASELSGFFAGQKQVAALAAASASRGGSAHPLGTVRYIGDYELLEEIARGGMGVVYKARQVSLERLVALKMILAGDHAGASDLARFRTEAQAVARLQHPNIVQIYEVGQHESHPYFSLEYCSGGSLAEKLNGTPLPAQQAAQFAETLAGAMHAAHEAGIVHRDLKPANILLQPVGGGQSVVGGQGPGASDQAAASSPAMDHRLPTDLWPQTTLLKITDFGLAKKHSDSTNVSAAGVTVSGAILGTPSYMAPEQAAGKGKEVGPSCDIYALGAILYEMLTGRPPFKAATPLETLTQVAVDNPAPPRDLQPSTPRDLQTICLKCLEKEPGKRYATAIALAEDLRRFQAGQPILARPARIPEKLLKWTRRNRLATVLVAALLIVMVASTLAVAWSLGRKTVQALAPRKPPLPLPTGSEAWAYPGASSGSSGKYGGQFVGGVNPWHSHSGATNVYITTDDYNKVVAYYAGKFGTWWNLEKFPNLGSSDGRGTEEGYISTDLTPDNRVPGQANAPRTVRCHSMAFRTDSYGVTIFVNKAASEPHTHIVVVYDVAARAEP